MTRLLVFTPTYGAGPHPATMAAIEALEFDGELTHEVSWLNPYPVPDLRNVTAQYQHARRVLLAGDYDALLCIEHDMVPPPNAAQTLWDDGGPVVYGVYMFRDGAGILNVCQVDGKKRLPGRSLSFFPDELDYYQRTGKGEVGGIGLGCTLIQRVVLEHIDFREGPNGNPCDIPFATDCIKLGVPQVGRFDVPCGHYNNQGVLLDPSAGDGISVRGWALAGVTFTYNGLTRSLLRNRYHTLPAPVAMRLIADGHVRPMRFFGNVTPAENLTYANPH